MWPFSWSRSAKTCRPVTLLQQLEDRIVLDAAVSIAHVNQPDHSEHLHTSGTLHHSHLLNLGGGDHAAAGGAWHAEDPVAKILGRDLNVVLISNALDQLPALESAVVKDAKVIVYDAQKDTLATIEQDLDALVQSTGGKIGHLSILSHGDPGVMKLATGQLFTASTVESNPGLWQALGSDLGHHARIDLYGCYIGQGSAGSQLVHDIANITGATVWASNDPTGNAPGSDWTFEVKSGPSKLGYLLDTSKLAGLNINLGDVPPILLFGDGAGSLDPAFGTGGKVTTFSGTNALGHAVAIQTDGKIVEAGYIRIHSIYEFALARYNANGSMDTSFGTGGIVVTAIGSDAYATSLAIQSDGKIIEAGCSGADFVLVRYNANGSLDTSFGTGGIVETANGSSDPMTFQCPSRPTVRSWRREPHILAQNMILHSLVSPATVAWTRALAITAW